MSTILKALRRLEEEQGARGEIPLREAVTASPQRPRRASRVWWIFGSIALFGLAIAGGFVLGIEDSEPGPQPVARTPVVATPSTPDAAATPSAPGASVPVAANPSAPGAPVPVAANPSAPGAPVPVAPSVPSASVSVAETPSVPAAGTPSVPETQGTAVASAPVAARTVPAEPDSVASGGLPAAAYASRVERVNRPLPEPRIREAETRPPGELQAVARTLPAAPEPQPSGAPAPSAGQTVGPVPAPSAGQTVGPVPAAVAKAEPDPWEQAAAAAPVDPSAESRLPLAAETTPVVKLAVPEPVAKSPVPAPAPVAKSPAPAPAPVAKSPAPAPAPVAQSPKAPAKVVARAAPAKKAALPDVQVAQTQWHPSAARRTALLTLGSGEAQEVHEGDEVGRFVVSRIEPSAVVFLADGDEVRRRVGED